ncbi:META domain-containing protein [Flavisolibacter tropicus]|uniref:DUF306 domain-containing protein n=1 Tax=Flavisolibacter tropicus TaxID=1492898 RepID=A0A172TWC7_9BACT|nr:META domain-containing protein [Flavisolibacter tropicus]ANE51385.1 hypothetical protein SY85_13585 [Flavisolibacter tropicus]
MKKSLWSTAIIATLLFLNYCSNTKQLTSQTEVLFRSKWKLAELQGQQVSDSAKSSFEFTPGKISGSTGCNRLSAGFVAGKHQTIRFSPDSLSKVVCSNETAAALEATFLDALSKSTEWNMKAGELWLGDGERTLIKLRSL